MPRPAKRQPRPVSRTVLSVSIPVKPDWVDIQRAAGMEGRSLSDFVRAAASERAARILGKDAESSPLDSAA